MLKIVGRATSFPTPRPRTLALGAPRPHGSQRALEEGRAEPRLVPGAVVDIHTPPTRRRTNIPKQAPWTAPTRRSTMTLRRRQIVTPSPPHSRSRPRAARGNRRKSLYRPALGHVLVHASNRRVEVDTLPIRGSSGHGNNNKCSPSSNQVVTRRRGNSSPKHRRRSTHNSRRVLAPPP